MLQVLMNLSELLFERNMDDLCSRRLCSLGPPVIARGDLRVAMPEYSLNDQKVDAMIHQISGQGPPQIMWSRFGQPRFPRALRHDTVDRLVSEANAREFAASE